MIGGKGSWFMFRGPFNLSLRALCLLVYGLRALVFYACGPFSYMPTGPHLCYCFTCCIDCIIDMLSLLSQNTARHLVAIQSVKL